MNIRRYCHQCGSQVYEARGLICCPLPHRIGFLDPMFVTVRQTTVRAMALHEWGQDTQKAVRALAGLDSGAKLTDLADALGWDLLRLKAVVVCHARPSAACFSPILATISEKGWAVWLTARGRDGLPANVNIAEGSDAGEE